MAAPWRAGATIPTVLSGEASVFLTADERTWIKDHPLIKVGLFGDSGPYCFTDAAGHLQGIDLDTLDLISRKTGLHFESTAYSNWAQALADAREHRIDAVGGLSPTAEREVFLAFSDSFGYSPDAIVSRTDGPTIFDLHQLADHRVGLARTNPSLRHMIQARAPSAHLEEFDNMREAVEAVAKGHVDFAVVDAVVGSFIVKSEGLGNVRIGVIFDESAGIHVGVRRDWPMLVGIVNRALASISTAEEEAIRSRWLPLEIGSSQGWKFAFRILAGVAAMGGLVLVILYVSHRRVARELQERRRIQGELEAAHGQVARVSQEKSELLGMVAHDLRSPLTGLMLGTDMLEVMGPGDARSFAETVTRMRDATQQMMRLTNDLVDIQAIEAGKRNYVKMPVDLSALLHTTVTGLQETAARKRIRLALRTPRPDVVIPSDATALRQVADNLISNAIKFSPAGSEISIALSRTEAGVSLQVSDRGPGIKREDRDRLFQKFGQASARPTGGEKSIGLGLWIVQRVVAGLGGEVWCESEPGAGATFGVDLPAAVEIRSGRDQALPNREPHEVRL